MQKLETQRPVRQPDTVPMRPHGRALSEASSAPSIPPQLELSESGPSLNSSFVDDRHLDKDFEASSSGTVSPRSSSRRDSPLSSSGFSATRTNIMVAGAAQSSSLPPVTRNNTQHQHTPSVPPQADAGAAVRSQQREHRSHRPSVALADTVRQRLQPDIHTARNKTRKRQGFWESFKF